MARSRPWEAQRAPPRLVDLGAPPSSAMASRPEAIWLAHLQQRPIQPMDLSGECQQIVCVKRVELVTLLITAVAR